MPVHDISLPGSTKSDTPTQACSSCEKDKPPEGGIQMSATRWHCASC
jgi:hypothetical protein